jgi:predicted RNA-binding protein associated with RNAse of E/G family
LGRFQGILREETSKRLVIEQRLRVRSPRREFGKVVVARAYLAVWFIFRRKWYDVGKFYDQEGKFTGYYCDIIRPVAKLLASPSKTSIITDLFLDLWISSDGRCVVLDEQQLGRAIRKRAIPLPLAAKARRELAALVKSAKAGYFPPKIVRRYQPNFTSRS